MRILILAILSLLMVGCSTHYPPLPTVKKVNINRYLGTWYEIARYKSYFEEGCIDSRATYSLKKNGEIKVVNECIKNGVLSKATGVAYTTNMSNSKLKVSFFRPFYANYWILMLGHNYQYALIGDPSRKYLWILSRTKTINKKLKKKILSKLSEFGYTEKKLIWTNQKGKI